MDLQISKLKHPKETFYGSLMLIIGGLIWAIIALAVLAPAAMGNFAAALVAAVYIGIIWFISYVGRAMLRAYMIGHYVMVGTNQFPHLDKMVEDLSHKAGLKKAPHAFVYNSSGVMNAMALTLVGRARYIWLTSALIDADSDDQVRFVIGHEIGHHVSGHLDQPGSLIKLPAKLVPFLGSAYSRACELSCDRIGAYLAGNISASRSALQMLACGSAKLNAQMNTAAFEEQERMVPSIAGWLLNALSYYPRHTRRVEALTHWYQALKAGNAAKTRAQADPVPQAV